MSQYNILISHTKLIMVAQCVLCQVTQVPVMLIKLLMLLVLLPEDNIIPLILDLHLDEFFSEVIVVLSCLSYLFIYAYLWVMFEFVLSFLSIMVI